MELSLTQENFTKALSACSRIATNKAGLPVLNNILLRTEKNRLLVAATNLELASATYIPAKVAKQGSITIPARLITEFVANLPKGTIELSAKTTHLTLKCGGYTSTLNGIDADEFPELPTIDEKTSIHYSLNPPEFKQAVSQTSFACSNDVTRPVLTGVFWHSHEGSLYLVGSDGHHLSERRLIETSSELAALIPTSTLHEILRLISDSTTEVDIRFDESQVRFRVGDTEITSRLIDGKYPDYRQLIRVTNEYRADVATSDLSRTTKIAALFARESGGSVTLSLDEETKLLSLQSVASEAGENSSEIPAAITGNGSVSLNSRYLTEVLAVIDADTIRIEFSGKLAPITITPATEKPDFTHIIMPLKS